MDSRSVRISTGQFTVKFVKNQINQINRLTQQNCDWRRVGVLCARVRVLLQLIRNATVHSGESSWCIVLISCYVLNRYRGKNEIYKTKNQKQTKKKNSPKVRSVELKWCSSVLCGKTENSNSK